MDKTAAAAHKTPPFHAPATMPLPSFPRRFAAFALLSLVSAAAPHLAAAAPAPAIVVAEPVRRTWAFAEDGVTFDSDFAAARLSRCVRLGPDRYALTTTPENRPVNASPWFAFKVSAAAAKTVTVQLDCDGTPLRYVPKLSVDGVNWIALPAEAFTPGPQPDGAALRLEVGPEPVWIAAQEIVDRAALAAWSRSLERLPFVTRTEIGRSVRGQPIDSLEVNAVPAGTRPGFVVVLGRQHPPEITGTRALMVFVTTLLADTPLARRFRERFAVLLVPLINPDGVDAGHWRHNARGVDTNRDWGVWDQPETRAVRDAIAAARARGPLFFHLDFHSSFIDDLYTQPDDWPSSLPGITAAWVAGIKERVPTYKLKRSASRTPTITTSHNWAHREFGIPTCTYEVGDNTDRVVLQAVAAAAAESFMEQLLAAPPPKQP